MAKCDMKCFDCKYDDCINDYVPKDAKEYKARYYQAHRDEFRRKKAEQYQERKAAGLCVVCGKRKTVPNRVRCLDCLMRAKKHDTAGRRRRGMLPNEHFDGVDWCRLCGKEKPVEGQQLCSNCLEGSRQRAAYARTFIDREKARKASSDFWAPIVAKKNTEAVR